MSKKRFTILVEGASELDETELMPDGPDGYTLEDVHAMVTKLHGDPFRVILSEWNLAGDFEIIILDSETDDRLIYDGWRNRWELRKEPPQDERLF